ncbi:hypothetical protein Tco_0273559 [Tanacetum coccineum]
MSKSSVCIQKDVDSSGFGVALRIPLSPLIVNPVCSRVDRLELGLGGNKQYDYLLVKLSDTDFKAATYKRGIALLKRSVVAKEYQMGLVARKHETEFKAITYKRGLDTVEAQLVTYRKNEQEKDAIEFKIEKFDKASKDLYQLLESQITDKSKKGLGYSVVPPPHPLIYNRPNKLDMSYSGLEEFQQPKFEVYGLRDNKSVCENSSYETKKNYDAPLIEEWVSDNEDEVESPIVVEKKTIVPTIPKVDVYTCKHKRHVNGQREEKPVWKNTRRVNDHYSTRMTHSNPRRNMIPQAVLMRSRIKAVNTAKPKDAHNAVKRNRFNTVKASACWVWMPKNRVVDHMDAQAQGRQECSKEKEESREECSKSRKTKKMKWEDCWELNTSELVLPRDELVLLSQQLVLLEENSSYCSRLQLPVLNQSVNTARITAVGEKVNAAESLLVVSTEVNAN